MEKLQFILHENVERGNEDGETVNIVSTLGYKFEFEGILYGNYVVINKPYVTAQDIMEGLEKLCPEIEQRLKSI